MRGLTMDYPLTLAAVARRAEALYARPPGREPARRPRAPPHHVPRGHASRPPPRRRRSRRSASAPAIASPRSAGITTATSRPTSPSRCSARCSTPSTFGSTPTSWPTSPATPRTGVVIVDECAAPAARDSSATAPASGMSSWSADGGAAPAGMLDYEALLAAAPEDRLPACPSPTSAPRPPCAIPRAPPVASKGVVYSHRALVLHSMATAMAGQLRHQRGRQRARRHADVPRQRVGASLHRGTHRRGARLPRAAPRARVTARALPRGAGHLQRRRPDRLAGRARSARGCPGRYDLSALRTIVIGGAAAPESLVRGLERAHGPQVLTSWGMTEIAPVGTLGRLTPEGEALPPDERHALRMTAGRPRRVARAPGSERGGGGALGRPHDGRARGARSLRRLGVLSAGGGRRAGSRPTAGSAPATSRPSTRAATSRSATGART